MADEQHHGHCLCGAVTVDVTGPLGDISACHCEPCTRWTGSMQMGMEIPKDRIRVEGPVKTFASSSFAQRAWCDTCGTTLWFADTEGEGAAYLELAPGLFDNAGGARLARVVYADCHPDGYQLAGDYVSVTKAEYESGHRHVEDAS